MQETRVGKVLLAILLIGLFVYEARQAIAQWYYYRSDTSSELHSTIGQFADRARLLETAIDISPTWEMLRSRGKLYLDEAILRNDEGEGAQRDALLDVSIASFRRATEMEPRECENYYDLV